MPTGASALHAAAVATRTATLGRIRAARHLPAVRLHVLHHLLAVLFGLALTFRRRAPRIARPGESPDDEAEQSGPEDGRRVLEGVTRWGGSQRLLLSFSGGRYSLGDAEPDLIQRVRWHLRDTEAGVGRTSRAAIAKALGVRDSAVGDIVRQLIERKEVADATEAGKSYLKATASMAIYAGRGPEAHGGAGEEEREEVYATGSECSSRFETPACTDGKSTQPIEDDGYFDALLADEASVGVEEQFG